MDQCIEKANSGITINIEMLKWREKEFAFLDFQTNGFSMIPRMC